MGAERERVMQEYGNPQRHDTSAPSLVISMNMHHHHNPIHATINEKDSTSHGSHMSNQQGMPSLGQASSHKRTLQAGAHEKDSTSHGSHMSNQQGMPSLDQASNHRRTPQADGHP